MKIKMYRSATNFCLLTGDSNDYRLNIEDIYILVKKIRVNPAVIYGHSKILEQRMRCIRSPELNVDLRASLRAAPPSTGKICFKGGNRKR